MTECVSVYGLGKVGLPLAACLSSRGFRVLGYDPNKNVIESIVRRTPHIKEPGLAELIKAHPIEIARNPIDAAVLTDVSFIIVPTPSRNDGSYETAYVESAVRDIAEGIMVKNRYHLVVLVSTVLPTDCDTRILPLLAESGKRFGMEYGFCYSPEFIALGDVINGILNPDVVLIGESDKRAGDYLEKMYSHICENTPPICRMSIPSAEIAKISLNTYVTTKITFANVVAEICEKTPRANADDVCRMLGHDQRIGHRYLKGGMAYGGPCFPRDNRALSFYSDKIGKHNILAESTDIENRYQCERITAIVKDTLGTIEGRHIVIYGLTYKPDTDVIESSPSVQLAESLSHEGARVIVYDPAGMENAKNVLGGKVGYADTALIGLFGADMVILATPWKEFKDVKEADFLKSMKMPVLLDCWRFYDPAEYSRMMYIGLGISRG